MIKRTGDLFTSDAPAYAHGVNCHGVMGAGIAKVFKEKYPDNYEWYRRACNFALRPGSALVLADGGKTIVNIASQNKPGADARYEWVLSGALEAAQRLRTLGLDRVAVPLIGCGIGGLQWPVVEHLLVAVEHAVPEVEWEVWKF